MFGLKRVGKNRPPPQLRWPWRACLRVLQPRCGNKLEKEAADLEKAAAAARKKVKEAKANEASQGKLGRDSQRTLGETRRGAWERLAGELGRDTQSLGETHRGVWERFTEDEELIK